MLSVTSQDTWNNVVSNQWNLSGSTFGDTIYRMKGPGSGGSGGEYVVNGTVLTEANNWEAISISGDPTLVVKAAYFVFIRSIGEDITIATSDVRQIARNYPGYTWAQKTAPTIGTLSVPAAGGGAAGSFSYDAPDAVAQTQIASFAIEDATGAVVSMPFTVGVAGSGVTANRDAGTSPIPGYTTGTGAENTFYSNFTWSLTSGPTITINLVDNFDNTWTYTFDSASEFTDSFTLTDEYGGTITYNMTNIG